MATTTTAAAQTAAHNTEATVYIILHRSPSSSTWSEDGPHQHARNADQAIRQAAQLRAESDVDPAGEYVAIPARSWNPTTVKIETTTAIRLGH